jgi:hypothetical protein
LDADVQNTGETVGKSDARSMQAAFSVGIHGFASHSTAVGVTDGSIGYGIQHRRTDSGRSRQHSRKVEADF